MRYKITHDTEYRYDSPVFLEPHTFRFRPRTTAYLTRESYALTVAGAPVGRRDLLDAEGNRVEFCWFAGLTDRLVLRAESVLRVEEYNPLAFIVYPYAYNDLPFAYDDEHRALLAACLSPLPVSEALVGYGSDVRAASAQNTVPFLLDLTARIHGDFSVIYRELGPPRTPDETFALREGSCRDLSWMMIGILRHLGIAARFASGYFYLELEDAAYELHAWVEAYLPGAGWVGLDPSHGIFAGSAHFPIASSAHHAHTMPVSGGIRGTAAATLTTHLSIEPLP